MEQVLACIKEQLAKWNTSGVGKENLLINGQLLEAKPLINPLLAVWSDDLDPAAQATLGAFIAMLPHRNLIAYKELEKLAADLQTPALVAV